VLQVEESILPGDQVRGAAGRRQPEDRVVLGVLMEHRRAGDVDKLGAGAQRDVEPGLGVEAGCEPPLEPGGPAQHPEHLGADVGRGEQLELVSEGELDDLGRGAGRSLAGSAGRLRPDHRIEDQPQRHGHFLPWRAR
jgi:hypothetical protein